MLQTNFDLEKKDWTVTDERKEVGGKRWKHGDAKGGLKHDKISMIGTTNMKVMVSKGGCRKKK